MDMEELMAAGGTSSGGVTVREEPNEAGGITLIIDTGTNNEDNT